MAIEDTFKGAKNAYIYYFEYLTTVAQEIGMEKAIDLNTRMCESRGISDGRIIKEEAAISEFDAKVIASLAKNYVESIGMSSEVIEVGPKKVSFRVMRCPLYEAAKTVGMEDETIESLCRAGPVRNMDSMVKQLSTNHNYKLTKFRSSEENYCEEVIALV